ncbi:MAG: 50S rRNA methyltransferase, partial [Gammaproteobacteria bacterium]|nr:50S rRNA methyltransferase [Gammaproteobacteria bacterium]
MSKNRDQLLTVPQGLFLLQRYPVHTNDQLRAWDAADEYVLNELAGQLDENRDSRMLIVNDGFGSISLALAGCSRPHTITMMTDSWLAGQGLKQNFANNHVDIDTVETVTSLA